MKNLIYKYNGDVITKEEADKILDSLKIVSLENYNKCINNLQECGHCMISTNGTKHYYYDVLCAAPQVVYDMSSIVADNEFDAQDGDDFNIAYALYKAGYGKINEGLNYGYL